MDEFALIDALLERLGAGRHGPAVVIGAGDDCALLRLPAGAELATSVDTLVPGVHIPADAPGAAAGVRALCMAVSDLAAMGADPLGCTLALTLPADGDSAWALDLAEGLGRLAARLGVPVVGGNIASGPRSVTVTVNGACPAGSALRRDRARPGDRVFVSGTIGLGALGLEQVQQGRTDGPAVARYWQPLPRLALGLALRGRAHAAIDLSDGLLADAGHLARASGVTLVLDVPAVPLPAGEHGLRDGVLSRLLGAGDDYELLCTGPAELAGLQVDGVALSAVGVVQPAGAGGPGLQLRGPDAAPLALPARHGWRHNLEQQP